MIFNLIKLGIKILLKTYCQKIKIKEIIILTENNIFEGNIKKLMIKAEDIIYRDFYLNYAEIEGFNLNIDFTKNSRFLKIKSFQAETTIFISNENLKNIINKNCSIINNKVKKFAVKNFNIRRISFNNQLILFETLKGAKDYKFIYKLNFDKHNLIMHNISSKKYLLIPFDQNIVFKSLNFDKKYLKIKFKSKVKLEN